VMASQWAERYGRSVRHERQPTGAAAMRQDVEQIGADGMALLQAVYGPMAPVGGPGVAAVEVLPQVWSSSTGMTRAGSCGGRGQTVASSQESGRDDTAAIGHRGRG
jgi:hypothetical protein